MSEKSISEFSSEFTSNVIDFQEQQIGEFLINILGDDYKLITGIAFDNDVQKFYDIKAPEHVIQKLRDAGYVRN